MPFFENTIKTPEIQSLLSNYQSAGVTPSGQEELPAIDGGNKNTETTPQQPSLYQQSMRMPIGRGLAESHIEEALEAGYGTSKYDMDFYPGMDLENSRALEQSGFSKIGTGLTKGGITAATTAVNTTLGTVWGLGSALYELALDANGNGRSFMDTMDAGVNNWLSSKLTNIQTWAEEAIPNYRTSQERTDEYQKQWYRHMGSANFIGDSILKNFGFTVGAMGGGLAWSKLIGSAMSKRLANNIMKGAVVAAEGDAEASAGMQRAAEAISRGTAVGVDGEKIAANIQNAARQINRMDARLQLYGSVIGAMGEGTVEGLMAKQEFLDDYKARMQQQYAQEYDNLENELLATGNPDWVEERVVQQPNGELVTVPTLTELGRKHLLTLQRQTTEKYQDIANFAETEGQRLASTTFLLNLPILTTSNLIQFGRMFSGGWKTNRANLSAVRGKANVTAGAKPGAEPKISANYTPKGGKVGRTILNSLKVAGTESFEEMAQGTVSSGTKQVADARLSAFNDNGYDDEATRTVKFWFQNMYSGGVDYLTDVKNWQEGALGALTGLFGMPGKRWSGGVVEAYRDANEQVNASRDAANRLNALVNSKEFQDRWHGYIRHLKYDNDMQQAIENDDEYAWHTADDAQLINDIILFADAGRLEDLNQIVSAYGKMTEADAAGIREVMKNADNEGADWTKNLSDKEIVEKVSKQAKKMEDTIKEYKDIYDALSSRAPIGTSPEFLKELVFTAQQIKSFDRRFLEMFGETMDGIEPILLAMSSVTEDGTVAPAAESAQRYKNLRDNYERLFAGSLLPVRVPAVVQKSMDSALDLLEEVTEDNAELNQKVKDMRALTEDRKEFYRKLQTLQGENAQKKFNAEAVTPEKVETAAEQVYATQQTQGLNTLNDVKQAYFEKDAKGRAEFLNTIAPLEDSNPAIKEFMKLKRRADGFRAWVDAHGVSYDNPTVSPPMIQSAINDLIRRAKSEDEFINLPDNVFSSLDEFLRDYTGPFGAPSAATQASVKKAIRDAMAQYMASETGTATRQTLSPTPVAPQPQPGTVATPAGRDAAQPASQELAPVAQEKQKEEKTGKKQMDAKSFDIDSIDFANNFVIIHQTGSQNFDSILQNGLHVGAGLNGTTTLANRETIQSILRAQSEGRGHEGSDGLIIIQIPKSLAKGKDVRTLDQIDDLLVERFGDTAIQTVPTDVITHAVVTQKPVIAQPQEVPVVQTPTSEQLLDDAAEAGKDDLPKEVEEEKVHEEGTKDKIAYYRTSVPEIETGEAKKAREAILKGDREVLKQADLSDFVQKHPGYAAIWNALAQRGAFTNVATRLELNDKIEFVVDPTFPAYDGQYQILMTTVKNGQRLVLNVLSGQNSKYTGLKELREAIDKEYREFIEKHPNEVFVFSKKSRVWAKRAGLIDYDFSGKGEKGIVNIPGYSEDAPIVFIGRDGSPQLVRGSDQKVLRMVSDTFDDAFYNKENGKVGNLYYLVKVDAERYAPIRLNVEHFREGNKDSAFPAFTKIRHILENIAEIVKVSNNTNLEEQNAKLREKLQELGKYLDIHNDFFEIGEYENVGVALRYSSASNDSALRRPNQMTADWLIDFVAGLGRSLQLKQDANGRITNLQEMLDTGTITSNARMLRPKGTDFYINPWVARLSDFGAVTQTQLQADAAVAQGGETVTPEPAAEVPLGDDFGGRDEFDDPEDTEPAYGEQRVKDTHAPEGEQPAGQDTESDAVMKMVQQNYSELPANIQAGLQAKGYSEDEFNRLPVELKERVLRCLGV